MTTNLPAVLDQPAAFSFSPGDRVALSYPLRLMVLGCGPRRHAIGTVEKTGQWISVAWDDGLHTLVNPAYLSKVRRVISAQVIRQRLAREYYGNPESMPQITIAEANAEVHAAITEARKYDDRESE